MKKRILALLLAVVLAASALPVAGTYAAASSESVFILAADEADAWQRVEEVSLPRGGSVQLCAQSETDGAYQWQIGSGADEWVDIQGAASDSLRVSYGLVASVLSDGAARVRCTVGEEASESVVLRVTEESESTAQTTEATQNTPMLVSDVSVVDRSILPQSAASEYEADEYANEQANDTENSDDYTENDALMMLALGDDENDPDSSETPDESLKIYTITIEYLYAAGTDHAGERVAPAHTEEYPANTQVDLSVTSPIYMGYTASQLNVTVNETITADKTITVYYTPAEVTFTVRHFQQNVADDQYTLAETTVATGTAEKSTEDYQQSAQKTYTGFEALDHAPAKIAGDGSTIIDIYYDRVYYLMSFELGGGYGVEPIYARYGAAVSVKEPTRAGYSFGGWSPALPTTMPAQNTSYKATWTEDGQVNFTVVYWLQNADTPDKYDYRLAVTQQAAAGATVNGKDYQDFKQYIDNTTLDPYAVKYSHFDHADENVTVVGDGTTVVNVYYDRNVYELKFYYAAHNTKDDTYKVVGGSTYPFGKYDDNNKDTTDELALLKFMYNSYSGNWGQITTEPTLNDRGNERKYTTGTNTVDGLSDVEFMYISFKARYGQDISNLWPCDVFNAAERSSKNNTSSWKGTTAYVSAWNGEHHVWYSQHNENQTIKGNYRELDYKLLFDSQYPDSETVCYLCFWENGADIKWSIPKLFHYNIWVPVLPGQDTTGKKITVKDDVTYYLLEDYDTCDNTEDTDENLAAQTAPAINGFTYNGRTWSKIENTDDETNFDATKYQAAYEVNFFYSRNYYELKFENGDTPVKTVSVAYEESLTGRKPADESLTYYQDGYEFDGWYTSPEGFDGTKFDVENETMPSNRLLLYAHWVPVTRTVTVYDRENGAQIGESIKVPNNTLVPEGSRPADPKDPDDKKTFVGWFYTDAAGEEHAFSFEGTLITGNMDIYAKWRSTQSKTVVVRFVVENADGTVTQIADTTRLVLRVGQTHTFNVKTGNSLYAGYRTNYFPQTASHAVAVEENPVDGENDYDAETGEYHYDFVYTYHESVPYTVEYKLYDANGKLRPAFRTENGKAVFVGYGETWKNSYTEYKAEHNDNQKAVVTEVYTPETDALANSTWSLPNGYVPDALRRQLVVIPNGDNTITFIYSYEESAARYSVNHYVENVDGTDGYTLYQWTEEKGTIGDAVKAEAMTISGYTFDSELTDERKQSDTERNGTTLSGKIKDGNTLELNFYYSANSYPYRVLYLEKDTLQVLADPKTADEHGNALTAKYGATVTETAKDIAGYRVDGSSTKAITIAQEAGNEANLNTIYFYYVRQSGGLRIGKKVALDPKQAGEAGLSELPVDVRNQRFTFTITAENNLPKSVYYYTLTEADGSSEDGAIVADTRTLTVTLKDGQSVYIKDLPLGKYTVTESYVAGFLPVTGETEKIIGETVEMTIASEGQTAEVNYENRYPFYTGELVVRKQVAKLDEANDPSPAAEDYYVVTVTLWPEEDARKQERVITWQNAPGAPEGAGESFSIPAWDENGTNEGQFSFDIYVPVTGENGAMGEVKLQGVPVGRFQVEEKAQGTGYITDYYKVTYNKALHQNDETRGTGATVSGDIHGGHPTAVTFTNTYKKGDLTIQKTVKQEYEKDSFESGILTFTITGKTELPDGEYTLGDSSKATVTNGSLTLTREIKVTKATPTASVTLQDLPAGHYTVTEEVPDGYTCDAATKTVTVGGEAVTAAFTNTFKRTTGSLTVSKTIQLMQTEGVTLNENQEFTFTLVPLDGTLTGTYSGLMAADNKLTFTLKHDQSITITDLPVGQYELRETAVDKYASSFDSAPNDKTYTKKAVTIETGKTAEVACVNSYPVNTATLVVSKNVVTPSDHSAIDQAPTTDRFQFTVKVSEYDASVDLSSFVQTKFTGTGTQNVTINGDDITFALSDGESMALTLPVCQFQISETSSDDYETSYTVGELTGESGKTYALVAGKELNVVFTNTYKRHYADLTITTKTAREEQNFLFDVASADGQIKLSVVLEGTDSIKVRDLPVGQYTVTERDDWSWREDALTSQTVTPNSKGGTEYQAAVTLDSENVTVAFDYGAVDRTVWLSGYSYGVKTGGGT